MFEVADTQQMATEPMTVSWGGMDTFSLDPMSPGAELRDQSQTPGDIMV